MRPYTPLLLIPLLFLSCGKTNSEQDASGVFESTEIVISAEVNGKLIHYTGQEGTQYAANAPLGMIDTVDISLKIKQLQSTQQAINNRKPVVEKQLAAIKEQLLNAKKDESRISNLVAQGAANQKQLDDIQSTIRLLNRQLEAQQSTLLLSTGSIEKEAESLSFQLSQLNEQIRKCAILSPIEGVILANYVEESEFVLIGKPLFKIANTSTLFLRAYITAAQFNDLKLGQTVTVFINSGEEERKSYSGNVTWIASKAEFTPKTIQTKDERQNLVYAIKIAVQNRDGLIKIGMYGDVKF